MGNDTSNTVGPVTAGERYASLDRLRGVAILGILVMNIYAFAMPFAGYMNPYRMGGTESYNLATWFFTHILFDLKFMSIFAILFGAGIVLMSERAEKRGEALRDETDGAVFVANYNQLTDNVGR